jgi:hypothetical protein
MVIMCACNQMQQVILVCVCVCMCMCVCVCVCVCVCDCMSIGGHNKCARNQKTSRALCTFFSNATTFIPCSRCFRYDGSPRVRPVVLPSPTGSIGIRAAAAAAPVLVSNACWPMGTKRPSFGRWNSPVSGSRATRRTHSLCTNRDKSTRRLSTCQRIDRTYINVSLLCRCFVCLFLLLMK